MNGTDRYSRHELLAEIGPEGQKRLAESRVLIVGCGALGSNQASMLARAGVGFLRIVDRDRLETSNLQRQVLFDEEDVAAGRAKAEAARRRLARINSAVRIEARHVEVTPLNVEEMIADVDIVLDGLDNLEGRYLLNDACVKHGKTWIYGGVVGTAGMALPIVPGRGPCLRCVFLEPPPPGVLPTTDRIGVVNTIPALIAAVQVTAAYRFLTGSDGPVDKPFLVHVDLWSGSFQRTDVERNPLCPACGEGRFEFLDRE